MRPRDAAQVSPRFHGRGGSPGAAPAPESAGRPGGGCAAAEGGEGGAAPGGALTVAGVGERTCALAEIFLNGRITEQRAA